MSSWIQDVRAEDIVAISSELGVRIKTGRGRGGFVNDIYVRGMTMHTMRWVFWMTGNYGSRAYNGYDPNALPVIRNINYRDMAADNVTMAAWLEGIPDVAGISSGVVPQTCEVLPDQGPEKRKTCDFPEDILPTENDENEFPVIAPLPSYGGGRDTEGGRFNSLIFGTNLANVTITGYNAIIDGQGDLWWQKFRNGELNYTRLYLIEIMFSENVQMSSLTLINSPSWNILPVYCSNVIVQGITILAPGTSPNTDGINPDSCTNTRIEDFYIVSGDELRGSEE
ncbi:hypothetical protein TIFTF001_003478 [Ficus carica]|uniref:Polygalacturonase n=1 Tax=Ficus carica TaxID=3494 RepID=A0AA88CRF8_FICCA|nr:hypothetical protein TIFTF001_003478 [Ficus carica]